MEDEESDKRFDEEQKRHSLRIKDVLEKAQFLIIM
jgi:hypothetical protein